MFLQEFGEIVQFLDLEDLANRASLRSRLLARHAVLLASAIIGSLWRPKQLTADDTLHRVLPRVLVLSCRSDLLAS